MSFVYSIVRTTTPKKKTPQTKTADDDLCDGPDDSAALTEMSATVSPVSYEQHHYPPSSSPLSTSTLSGSGGTVIDLSACRTSTPLRVVQPVQPAKHGFYVDAAPATMAAMVQTCRSSSIEATSDYVECSPAGTELLQQSLLCHSIMSQHTTLKQRNSAVSTLCASHTNTIHTPETHATHKHHLSPLFSSIHLLK